MNLKAIGELIAIILAVLAAIFASLNYMNSLHATRQELKAAEAELEIMKWERLQAELGVRKEIVNRDVKKDAEARAHYKRLMDDRPLEPAEERRMEYLEEQMALKYKEQEMLQQAEMDMKRAVR